MAGKVEVEWRQDMAEKKTLHIYRRFKRRMEEIDFDGGPKSGVWLRARLNCMDLEEIRGTGRSGHM